MRRTAIGIWTPKSRSHTLTPIHINIKQQWDWSPWSSVRYNSMSMNHGRQRRRSHHHRLIRWNVEVIVMAFAIGFCVMGLGVFHGFSSFPRTTTSMPNDTPYLHPASSPGEIRSKSYISPEILMKKQPSSFHHKHIRNNNNNNNNTTHEKYDNRHPQMSKSRSQSPFESPIQHQGTSHENNTQYHPAHAHSIPNTLIFTHYINLLQHTNFTDDENYVLRENVLHTMSLHPNATIRFLTDDDCIDSIRAVMGNDTPLIDFFRHETEGMFKADICRGAALYQTGGLYFDIDLRARLTLWDAIQPRHTSFVVPKVHLESKHKGSFFQAFIGSTPHHPFLRRYLELFVQYYQGKVKVKGPLGVILLRRAHDEILKEKEKDLHHEELHHHSHHSHYQDDSDIGTVVHWQEVKYRKDLFPHVPPPNWGTRRACRMVVVAARGHDPEEPFIVPFYSRVKGSRMCGGKDTHKKG